MKKIGILMGVFFVAVFCAFCAGFFIYKDNIRPYIDEDAFMYLHASSRHLHSSAVSERIFSDAVSLEKSRDVSPFFELISSLSGEYGVSFTSDNSWSLFLIPHDKEETENLLIFPAQKSYDGAIWTLSFDAFDADVYATWHNNVLEITPKQGNIQTGAQDLFVFPFSYASLISDYRGISLYFRPELVSSAHFLSDSIFGKVFSHLGDASSQGFLVIFSAFDEAINMSLFDFDNLPISLLFSGFPTVSFDFFLYSPSDTVLPVSTLTGFWNIISDMSLDQSAIYRLYGDDEEYAFFSILPGADLLIEKRVLLYFQQKYPAFEAVSLEDGTLGYEFFMNDNVVFEDVSQGDDVRYKIFVENYETDSFFLRKKDGFVLFSRDNGIFSQNIDTVYDSYKELESSCALGGGTVHTNRVFEGYDVFEICFRP